MNTYDNRQKPHDRIDHIFKDLLPAHGMPERPAQIELCHLMLDAMLDGSIALCDAGTGIGKTYAYLVAGTAFLGFRADWRPGQSLSPHPASPCKARSSTITCRSCRIRFWQTDRSTSLSGL